ncbi:hypothetical protein F3I62_19130 [Pseudomonas sp. R-28-1W-6]|uniref:hypothetical protein n=1 Tax=Pseudomonas sp. R-28-1W-6 TaxID=2650101 RepID=UPI001365CA95|nr:hypothetical protein [Pseudomonas sp. R-28-1W-6]MWV14220.1 hypothetical protein [Pseudomonas sp. R-28-1W-6]
MGAAKAKTAPGGSLALAARGLGSRGKNQLANQEEAPAQKKTSSRKTSSKSGFLHIEDPHYSEAQKQEYLDGPVYSTSARTTPTDKFFLIPALVLKDRLDPKLSSLDGRSLLKLSLFIMNGIDEDYLARAIAYSNSLPDVKGKPASIVFRERFREDFVGDELRERLCSVSGARSIGYSKIFRYAMCLIGILSDDEILDDVLREAIDLQQSFGMDLLTKEK